MDTQALLRQISGCSTKTAKKITEACQIRSLGTLSRVQFVALGATERQAERLTAALSLGTLVFNAQQQACEAGLRNPNDVILSLRNRFNIAALEQEHFWVMALNSRQKILDVFTVAVGSLSEVSVHPREVFKPLVRMAAHSCIVAHNHPSNDPEPSQADVGLTDRLVTTGKLLGIPVIDHIIITATSSVSLASRGLM